MAFGLTEMATGPYPATFPSVATASGRLERISTEAAEVRWTLWRWVPRIILRAVAASGRQKAFRCGISTDHQCYLAFA